ncbi:MAG: SCP2 sterol-binding domain-containing protein [Myxococcota bacterium]
MADAKTDFETNIPAKIAANPDTSKAVGAIFLFKISGDNGGTWTVNLKDEVGVSEGEVGEADCTLELTDEDWSTISENAQAAMQLYFQGKLKVSGNPMLATKLQTILG